MDTRPAIDLLKREEGFKPKPYRDTVGKLTIGYGRNLDDRGITQDEALYLLCADVEPCYNELHQTYPWFDRLSPSRKAVLVSMDYQMGLAGLKKFKLMLAALERADWDGACKEMLSSVWAKQTPARARRQAEIIRLGVG